MSFPGAMRAFYEVVCAGSIRRASERLNTSPSSVSRQIALLEHEIGTPLFDREATGMTPTHAGRLVADYARSVVLDYDSLRSDLNDLKGERRAQIRIAVIEGMVCEGAIHAVRTFTKRFPKVSFKVTVLAPDQIATSIAAGDYDVGVSFCQPPCADIDIVHRIADPVQLAVGANHELATREFVALHDLERYPFGMLESDRGLALINYALIEAGLSVQPTLISNSIEAVRSFIRGGHGVALLSKRAVEREVNLGCIVSIPVRATRLNEATVDVLVLKKRRLSNVVRRFVEQIGIELEELSDCRAAA
ncbi:MAG TPA: LysR family transcriptional regulator [Caulobacteraceae bacterium]|nr:LysR family transcriptional regulator [Caulobacteraceae bacterium]